MQLLWEDLKFWNQKQALICKRLDEDFKKYWKLKYLKWLSNQEIKEQIKQCEELEQEAKWKDKYNKSLIQVKINNIIWEIVKPMIEKRKEFYEKHYNAAIIDKRQEYIAHMQKKFKWREIVLPF